MDHKPNSIFEAAYRVLTTTTEAHVIPPRRVSKEIHYTTKRGEDRVVSVSPPKEAEEIRTIKALGGKIIKVDTVTH